jgi:hypothetical protein
MQSTKKKKNQRHRGKIGKASQKVKKSKLGLGSISKDTQSPITQLLCTLKAQLLKAQFDLGPDESKAQLKWAPATSKYRK